MGRMLRIGLAVAVPVLLFAVWHSYRATPVGSSSFRQMIIDGDPVCVFQDGEDIVARIGECPEESGGGNGSLRQNTPFHGQQGMELPPGHPPVDDKSFTDDRRTIPI